jgi:hypothetical protein
MEAAVTDPATAARAAIPVANAYRFTHRRAEIVAVFVARVDCGPKRGRVVVRDTAEAYWLLDIAPPDGRPIRVAAGPITVAEAVERAAQTLAGIEHGSVTERANVVAIGLVAAAVRAEEGV